MADLSKVLGVMMASGMAGRSNSGPAFAAAVPSLMDGTHKAAGMSFGQKAGLAALAYLAYRAYQGYSSDEPSQAEPAKKGHSGAFGPLFNAIGVFQPKDPAAASSPGLGSRISGFFSRNKQPDGPPPGAAMDDDKALLLIRAMIAAANADGEISDTEQRLILNKLDQSGAGPDERRIVEQELQAPKSLDQIVGQVKDPETAEQVYVASKLAVSGSQEVNENYLNYLASRLQITPTRRQGLDQVV